MMYSPKLLTYITTIVEQNTEILGPLDPHGAGLLYAPKLRFTVTPRSK